MGKWRFVDVYTNKYLNLINFKIKKTFRGVVVYSNKIPTPPKIPFS